MSDLHFEWDSAKATRNRRVHRITFDEAATAFSDEHGLLLDDPEHSGDEDRFVLLGLSSAQRLLLVVHCYRQGGDTIRLISARRATAAEQRQYAERWTP
jgi:uncharacterized DUF497 family protein